MRSHQRVVSFRRLYRLFTDPFLDVVVSNLLALVVDALAVEVDLVLRGSRRAPQLTELPTQESQAPQASAAPLPAPAPQVAKETPPRTGVEVVSVEERNQGLYYTLRDLRNGNVVKNVTQKSARRLWHYAITHYAELSADPTQGKNQWQGNLGLARSYKQGKSKRYDLVQRVEGDYRYYFGVTDDGIHGPWKKLVGQEDD